MNSYKGNLGLVFVTMIWGSTFVVTKWGLDDFQPFTYLAIRFWLAFFCLALIFGTRIIKAFKKHWLAGVNVGLILFLGYAFQTYGLEYTTASKSGFITGMAVVLTPLLSSVMFKQRIGLNTILGAISSFIGLSILGFAKDSLGSVNLGDILSFFCAVAFALHIIFIGKYANSVDTGILTTLQIGVVASLCTVFGLANENLPSNIPIGQWLGLAYMGIVATALVLFIQNWAQKFISSSRTAIIFTLEPVFAALFSIVFLHETLGTSTILGGSLIVLGLVMAEVNVTKKLNKILANII